MSSPYLQVSYQLPSDAKRIVSSMGYKPLTITNVLGVGVKVYCTRLLQGNSDGMTPAFVNGGKQETKHVGTIQARGKLTIPNLVNSDVLTFTTGSHEYQVTPSYSVNHLHGNITIGATVVGPSSYQSSLRSTGDILNVVMYNHLPWPVKVFFRGDMIGYIDANRSSLPRGVGDWNPSSTAPQVPYIYFDNQNNGINVGEVFTLQVDAQGIPEDLYSVKITSADTHDIYIGVTSTSNDSHIRDSLTSYHIGKRYVQEHNAKGTDAPRSSGPSRVPIAKYLPLSDKGVAKFC